MRSNIDDCLICDVALAVSSYNYYGYVSSGADGRYVILRESVAETEYRYAFGNNSAYVADWANKANLDYVRPNQLQGRG